MEVLVKWCGWKLIIDNPYDRRDGVCLGVTALSRGE